MGDAPVPRSSALESQRVRHILDEARALMRESGWRNVSMRRLASRLDVKAPSLYKHISGKDELYRLLLDEMLHALGDALHTAIAEDPSADSLLAAYRKTVLNDPHAYHLLSRSREVNFADPSELVQWLLAPFTTVAGDPTRGKAMWAFAHGLVSAELVQDQGVDVDEVWHAGAVAFTP
ncbi:MAG TPA: TetR/AcrR family transcriptional regulator [Actinomycetales bacterium]|uniref:TetR/AcrR family transcriptional regulator n=1 Tax=uncultured Corynebacterium sp. TaxID=159447 RepID=UPI00176E150E|nr:TetR/AcrR family transcriptional regulator [uncultured Corynebacterium sp.]HHU45122.1 TetR/AcrR family transcriptional regulator [Actinomycetales bacterium]